MNNKSGKILVCDVCGSHTDHVVCFNSRKENEVRVCKDCMERATGAFEDEKPKRKPEERKPEDGHANKHRDQMIKGLRDDLKKKMDLIKRLKEDLVSTEKAYNNRVEKLVIENTHMKESLGNARENLDFYKNMYGASEKKRMESVKEYGKLSNGLVKVMIIVALLGIGVGVITTALLMR